MRDVAALQPTAQRCAAVQLAKTDELVWRDERGRTFLRTGDMGEIVRTLNPSAHPSTHEYSRGQCVQRGAMPAEKLCAGYDHADATYRVLPDVALLSIFRTPTASCTSATARRT
jgi:hypothetical protein